MWYKKLSDHFEERKISNKQLAEVLGYSPGMISRYLNGKDNINVKFITVLLKNFPEINLQYIFNDNYEIVDGEMNLVEEPQPSYMNVDFELQKIETKLSEIRAHLKKIKEEK